MKYLAKISSKQSKSGLERVERRRRGREGEGGGAEGVASPNQGRKQLAWFSLD